jgi:hypothetical protein
MDSDRFTSKQMPFFLYARVSDKSPDNIDDRCRSNSKGKLLEINGLMETEHGGYANLCLPMRKLGLIESNSPVDFLLCGVLSFSFVKPEVEKISFSRKTD